GTCQKNRSIVARAIQRIDGEERKHSSSKHCSSSVDRDPTKGLVTRDQFLPSDLLDEARVSVGGFVERREDLPSRLTKNIRHAWNDGLHTGADGRHMKHVGRLACELGVSLAAPSFEIRLVPPESDAAHERQPGFSNGIGESSSVAHRSPKRDAF